MKLKIYQVDAFSDRVFSGNPAAVCPLQSWPDTGVMQSIALENNLAETAFYVPEKEGFHIRWFTPAVEVDLCGHATLAAAHVLFNHEGYNGNEIHFNSRSGILKVKKDNALLTLDFPTDVFNKTGIPAGLAEGLGTIPTEIYKGKTDYMAVFESEEQILALQPDLRKLATIGGRGLIVTARGNNADFVSRFFAPQAGIDEDPVTGSAHTTLTPYWAKVLGKNEMKAVQLSPRRGYLQCAYKGDRVEISGSAVTYLKGEIEI